MNAVDPVTAEIIRHRLDAINEEAAIILRRVSGSQVAVEASDLNTAITTADGTVIACGNYVLCQVASLGLVAADILATCAESPGIAAGDQFLTNDPYVGTLHQPDVVVVAPVFVDGVLVAWCGSTVHQQDVGGPTPGAAGSRFGTIFDEPPPVPPVRIVEGDVIRHDIERGFLRHSRTPRLNALDLAGQIAANRSSVRAIGDLCRRYGVDAVVATMQRLLDAAESRLRDRLLRIPDGRWRHVAFLEHGPPRADCGDVSAVRLTVTKIGDGLTLDFSESSAQVPGSTNAARPALVNFTVAAVLVYLCGGLPWVAGAVTRVTEIRSTPGTIVDARWPAGVAMSTATTCQAIRIGVNACLSRMLEAVPELAPHTMASCQSSGAGGGVLSGAVHGEPFASMTLDELTGGGGALADRDGVDAAGSTTSPGASCANIEVNESYLPVLYLRRALLVDSGGPGRFRGGGGTVIAMRAHGSDGPVRVVSFGQGLQHPAAAGLDGGDPGRQSLVAIGGTSLLDDLAAGTAGPFLLPGPEDGFDEQAVHVGTTQGGGGYGDPLDRPARAVVADVRDGMVSPAGAARDYGVVVVADARGEAVPDEPATMELRDRLRAERIGGRTPAAELEPPVGVPFTAALRLIAGETGAVVACSRCGHRYGPAADDPYRAMTVQERPAWTAAPFGARYPGAERFVVRRLCCPACGRAVDVQVALLGTPVLRSAEPLEGSDQPPAPAGPDRGGRPK